MTRKTHRRKKEAPQSQPIDNVGATALGRPVFSQPAPTADPRKTPSPPKSANAPTRPQITRN